MYIQELKAIELCLRYMSEKKNLNDAIHQEFEDTEDFNKAMRSLQKTKDKAAQGRGKVSV